MKSSSKKTRDLRKNDHTQSLCMQDMFISLFLFFVFFIVYFNSIDINAKNFLHWNIIFDADPGRAIKLFTQENPPNMGIFKHPLCLLFFNKLTRYLDYYIRNSRLSTLAVTCFFGTITIPLTYVVFFKYLKKRLEAVLFVVLFGCSSSFWLMCSIPEFFSSNMTMMILAFYLQMVKVSSSDYFKVIKFNFVYSIYSLMSIGLTVANIVYSFLGYINFHRKRKDRFIKKIIYIVFFIIFIILLLISFSHIQRKIYPQAYLFSNLKSFIRAFQKTPGFSIIRERALWDIGRITNLLKTFLLDSIIAPKVVLKYVYAYTWRWNILGFADCSRWFYYAASFFYISFFIFSIRSFIVNKLFRNKNVQLAIFFVVATFIMNFFFKNIGVPFIYSVHVTFGIIFLFISGYKESNFRFKRIYLIFLMLLIIFNNASFLSAINNIIHSAHPQKAGPP